MEASKVPHTGRFLQTCLTCLDLSTVRRSLIESIKLGPLTLNQKVHPKNASVSQMIVLNSAQKMMELSYQLWEEAQQEAGVRVYTQTGGLDFGRRNNHELQVRLRLLAEEAVLLKVSHTSKFLRAAVFDLVFVSFP